MDILKLHQPLSINTAGLNNLKIGNSLYRDDVWDLSPLIEKKTLAAYIKKVNFSYIHSEEMKEVVKSYAYYLLSNRVSSSIQRKAEGSMRVFISFCKKRSIQSFREITTLVFNEYIKYLKEEKQLAPSTGYSACYVVEELITVGQIKGWAVPKVNIFLTINASKAWGEQIKAQTEERKHKDIPDKIFNKILDSALNKEKNILTKMGIIIQCQTGLRISEVLGIKKGCISPTNNGDYYMTVMTPKTEKDESVTHKIFVNQLVVDSVKELEDFTENLREESDLEELFLVRTCGIIDVVKSSKFQENRIGNFIKRHDIRDVDGELYNLNTHQFRVHFVNELIKKKVPLAFIMKHFNHVSMEMTQHYSRLNAQKVAEMVKDIIKPNSKIAGLNANMIKRNLNEHFKGKTEQEIEKFVSELSKNMYINPLPTGMCLQDSRRGGCDNADGCIMINCPNYVTSDEYYPIHKRELDLLEAEMNRYDADGRVREHQRLKAKWIYLKPIVDSLEEQINAKTIKG